MELPAPGVFTGVNDVVEELDIQSAGSVTYEGRFGTGGNYRPTYVTIFEGQEALRVLQDRLEAAGFESNGFDEEMQREEWDRGLGTDDYCFVVLHVMDAGDGVYVGPSGSRNVESPSVFIGVTD